MVWFWGATCIGSLFLHSSSGQSQGYCAHSPDGKTEAFNVLLLSCSNREGSPLTESCQDVTPSWDSCFGVFPIRPTGVRMTVTYGYLLLLGSQSWLEGMRLPAANQTRHPGWDQGGKGQLHSEEDWTLGLGLHPQPLLPSHSPKRGKAGVVGLGATWVLGCAATTALPVSLKMTFAQLLGRSARCALSPMPTTWCCHRPLPCASWSEVRGWKGYLEEAGAQTALERGHTWEVAYAPTL